MLVCLTAHQRTTPLDALERLSVIGDDLAPRLRDAHESIRGAVVLSTCNRFEAYFDLVDDPELPSPIPAMDAAMEELSELAGLPYRDVRETVDFAHGNRVAHHLFSVASGLDSVAVGEEEISGQVGRALTAARDQGMTTAPLEHLFQRAAETSRAVKNGTQLSESGRSLVRLAVDLVSSRLTWATARVLLVGTGRYAAATLAALRSAGATDIRVHSRTGRKRFAQQEHLTIVPVEEYAAEAAAADLVITCTAVTDRFVLEADAHDNARGIHSDPQIIIDLGMPRNVDPRIGEFAGIELLDLDTIRVHAPVDEVATIGQAREIVATSARRHAAARRVHEVAPEVVHLRGFVRGLVDEELARNRRAGAPPEVEAALRRLSGVMLHHLIAQGHTLAANGSGTAWAEAVRTVFPDLTAGDDHGAAGAS
ncbi:glutamyl-tRNA reductase [Microbacterium invictum]|uniref:Glutamyl-tRNA reductase n=1 Tax=Microbacterium invictum TaxID=515415 RepID=A0AA40VLI5_9MICO|nr:glutamyl-tRNA reductase [Microbacterium invictum]MBB4138634.1 glutamyl-tRNA reductase [Microbacterium invictum]